MLFDDVLAAYLDAKRARVRPNTYVGGNTRVWGTKTAKGRRTVVLPRYAMARIRELRRRLRPSGRDLLCALRPSAIYGRMRRWFHSHGLDMCAERLRHYWATIAVGSGVPIETVAMDLVTRTNTLDDSSNPIVAALMSPNSSNRNTESYESTRPSTVPSALEYR